MSNIAIKKKYNFILPLIPLANIDIIKSYFGKVFILGVSIMLAKENNRSSGVDEY